VSGVAINFLASGLTVFLGQAWFGEGGKTPQLPNSARFMDNIHFPAAAEVRDIPLVGSLYADVLSGHNILVYAAFLAVPLTAWVIYRTRFGLRLRAVGENPAAVDTAGISVTFLRYRAVIITGILCGIAGAYLSIAQSAGFGREMTAGQGYIALAALIFANWRPWRVLGATFLFGVLNAIAIRMQGVELPGIGQVPVQFIQALPYILTVILLAGFIGKSIPPKAGGVPYVKER
jgi:simple sugar transport system permease protein